MEEMLGNEDNVRRIFEDWMTWNPKEHAWNAYLKFEQRHGSKERCRNVLERFIDSDPMPQSYIKAATFEEHSKDNAAARIFYERALAELGKRAFNSEHLFISFTRFEVRQKEFARARKLYEYGITNIPTEQAKLLQEEYAGFQRQYGTRQEIEEVVIAKKRTKLEQQVK